jgi:hypothetical protein
MVTACEVGVATTSSPAGTPSEMVYGVSCGERKKIVSPCTGSNAWVTPTPLCSAVAAKSPNVTGAPERDGNVTPDPSSSRTRTLPVNERSAARITGLSTHCDDPPASFPKLCATSSSSPITFCSALMVMGPPLKFTLSPEASQLGGWSTPSGGASSAGTG